MSDRQPDEVATAPQGCDDTWRGNPPRDPGQSAKDAHRPNDGDVAGEQVALHRPAVERGESRTPGATGGEGRLHPAVLGVWGVRHLWPLVLLLLTGSVGSFVALPAIALGSVAGVLNWLRFTYRLDEGTLVIEQGLLERKRRVIPFERIQSVDVVRKLRHRLFGVVELRVETVGGSDTEGRFEALSPRTAEDLRRRLLRLAPADGADREVDEESGDVLARLSVSELVLAGVTGGRVGVVAALLGFAEQALGDRIGGVFERVTAMVGDEGPAFAVTAVVAFVLVVFVISVFATALAYWNFVLLRDGDVLRVRRGLLEERHNTIPLRRLQAVTVEQNIVRQVFRLASVKVEVAGSAGERQQSGSDIALPLGSRETAFSLAERILERPGLADVILDPMPVRARTRRLVRAGVVAVVATVPLVLFFDALGLLGLALVVPGAGLAMVGYRSLGHGRVGDVVVARSGVLVRRTAFVPEPSLQTLQLRASPAQRRLRLASLVLQIARSGGSDPAMIDLDARDAEGMLHRLAPAAARGADRPAVTHSGAPGPAESGAPAAAPD